MKESFVNLPSQEVTANGCMQLCTSNYNRPLLLNDGEYPITTNCYTKCFNQ